MIGPNGLGGMGAPKHVTSVQATDRTVAVLLGDEFIGERVFNVRLWLSIDDDSPDPVEIHWSGSRVRAHESIEYANRFAVVLAEAIQVAEELANLTTDRTSWWWKDANPEIAQGIISGRSDWMLCAYLILNGVGAFYDRKLPSATETEKERGVHDLQGLRETATRLVLDGVAT